jgi:hypothetical protein
MDPDRDFTGPEIVRSLFIQEASDHEGKNFPFARSEEVVVLLQLGELRTF